MDVHEGQFVMQESPNMFGGSVEPFPGSQSTVITDELRRILGLLQDANPNVTSITFEFNGQLHAHIDLRRIEEISIVEERLRFIGGGHLFSDVRRGKTPNHPFHHRVSMLVAR